MSKINWVSVENFYPDSSKLVWIKGYFNNKRFLRKAFLFKETYECGLIWRSKNNKFNPPFLWGASHWGVEDEFTAKRKRQKAQTL